MKKIIFLAFMSTLGLTTFSQVVIPTYKNTVGIRNIKEQKYDFNKDWVFSNIDFVFYKTYITTTDAKHSIYRIIEAIPRYENDNVIINTAKCLDENNRECKIGIMIIKNADNQANIGVIYSDRMFMYMININKLGY
jgi:hypothetical protein